VIGKRGTLITSARSPNMYTETKNTGGRTMPLDQWFPVFASWAAPRLRNLMQGDKELPPILSDVLERLRQSERDGLKGAGQVPQSVR
jgi:hypothetical protein